jgi:hypothetical protein
LPPWEDDASFGDWCLYRETYRGDGDGNETPEGEFFRYEFINFAADVEEIGDAQ